MSDPGGHPAPHAVLGVGWERAQYPWWGHDYFASRSLVQSFMLALGQARFVLIESRRKVSSFFHTCLAIFLRLLHGDEAVAKMGELEQPIAVQFVFTNGQKYYFSAFQGRKTFYALSTNETPYSMNFIHRWIATDSG